MDVLLEGIETAEKHVTAWCDDGYSTSLALDDITGGRAWVVFDFDGRALEPEHGGPARLLVPHVYLWKSAKWLRRLAIRGEDTPGFGEQMATTCTAIRGNGQRYSDYDLSVSPS